MRSRTEDTVFRWLEFRSPLTHVFPHCMVAAEGGSLGIASAAPRMACGGLGFLKPETGNRELAVRSATFVLLVLFLFGAGCAAKPPVREKPLPARQVATSPTSPRSPRMKRLMTSR